MNEIIKNIHKSKLFGTIVEFGVGNPITNALYNIDGSEKTIAFSCASTNKETTDKILGGKSSTNFDTISFIMESNIEQAVELYSSNFVMVVYGKINNTGVSVWFSLYCNNIEKYYHVTIPVTIYKRNGRKHILDMIANIGIRILNKRNRVPKVEHIDHIVEYNKDKAEFIQSRYETIKNSLVNNVTESYLVFGKKDSVRTLDEILFRNKLFVCMQGSFKPIHAHQIKMLEHSATKYKTAPYVIVSLDEYTDDKGSVDINDLLLHIEEVNKCGYDVIVCKEADIINNINNIRQTYNYIGQVISINGSDVVCDIIEKNADARGFKKKVKDITFLTFNRSGYDVNVSKCKAMDIELTKTRKINISGTEVRCAIKENNKSLIKKYIPAPIRETYFNKDE